MAESSHFLYLFLLTAFIDFPPYQINDIVIIENLENTDEQTEHTGNSTT